MIDGAVHAGSWDHDWGVRGGGGEEGGVGGKRSCEPRSFSDEVGLGGWGLVYLQLPGSFLPGGDAGLLAGGWGGAGWLGGLVGGYLMESGACRCCSCRQRVGRGGGCGGGEGDGGWEEGGLGEGGGGRGVNQAAFIDDELLGPGLGPTVFGYQ